MPLSQAVPVVCIVFFFQAEDGIRDSSVTGVQTCALPICYFCRLPNTKTRARTNSSIPARSEEHTSELQSHLNLVCRLLLEKKKQRQSRVHYATSAISVPTEPAFP